MIAYTVYGMTCMFLYVEREQSVVARGGKRDVLWVWSGRPAGWQGSQPRHGCVRSAPLKPARPPSRPRRRAPADLGSPKRWTVRGRGPQFEKASEVRYFNTERSYMSGSFDILNSCCCPVWSTVHVPPPLSPWPSILLYCTFTQEPIGMPGESIL